LASVSKSTETIVSGFDEAAAKAPLAAPT